MKRVNWIDLGRQYYQSGMSFCSYGDYPPSINRGRFSTGDYVKVIYGKFLKYETVHICNAMTSDETQGVEGFSEEQIDWCRVKLDAILGEIRMELVSASKASIVLRIPSSSLDGIDEVDVQLENVEKSFWNAVKIAVCGAMLTGTPHWIRLVHDWVKHGWSSTW